MNCFLKFVYIFYITDFTRYFYLFSKTTNSIKKPTQIEINSLEIFKKTLPFFKLRFDGQEFSKNKSV